MKNRLLSLLVAGSVAAVAAGCAGSSAPPVTTAPLLSADELCRRVPLTAVAAAFGEGWQRTDDPSGRCRYQSNAKKTATATIAATGLTAEAWRRSVEAVGGKVVERDGVLVADYAGDGFGPLDELWWSDGSSALVLRIDNGLTLEQALALVAVARAGGAATALPSGTGTTVAAPGSSASSEPPATDLPPGASPPPTP